MEGFFYIVGRFDEVDLLDLILRRYGSLSVLDGISVVSFSKLLEKALDSEEEDHHRAQWNTMLPFMSMGLLKYVSFKDYCAQCSGKNIDMRPDEEILAEVERIREEMKGGYE